MVIIYGHDQKRRGTTLHIIARAHQRLVYATQFCSDPTNLFASRYLFIKRVHDIVYNTVSYDTKITMLYRYEFYVFQKTR